MKPLASILFVLLFLWTGHSVQAQTLPGADDLEWQITELYDLNYDSLMSYQASFVRKGDTINWVQQNGAFVLDFKIESSEGTWTDLAQDGKIQYSGTLDGFRGTLSFERKESKLTV